MIIKRIFEILLLITFFSVASYSKDLIDTDQNYKIGLGFSYANSSSYYNSDGASISETGKFKNLFFEGENGDSLVTVVGTNNVEFVELHTKLLSEFKLTDNITAELNFDLVNYSFESEFTFKDTIRDENGEIIKDNFGFVATKDITVPDQKESLFRLQYINPRLNYYLLNEKDKLRFQIGANIPTGFEERTVYNDSIFLDDGLLEFDMNAFYRIKFETSSLQFGAGYKIRNEIYSNLYSFNLGVNFTKIENTRLYILAEYNGSVSEPSNQNFVLTEFPSFESYINTKFGFEIKVSEYELAFGYTFVPWGKNYWLRNNIDVSFHYYIK